MKYEITIEEPIEGFSRVLCNNLPIGCYDHVNSEFDANATASKAEIAAARRQLPKLLSASGSGLSGFPEPDADSAQPEAAFDSAIPPKPDEDPTLGDKTPAVVEWFRDYHPDEFRRRYAGRKTHLGRIF